MTYQQPSQAPSQGPPTPPAQPRRGSAWRWGCALGLAGCLLVLMIGALLVLGGLMRAMGAREVISVGGDRIALIRVEGMLVAGQSGFSLFGGAAAGSDDIVHQIERAVEDREVEGILLRVNSPGGSAAASQEIYQAIGRAKGEGKIVVVSMADVAASGGYYIAAPADKIYADPATITGSIGAIAMHEDMSGLFEKIGISPEVIKSGKLKDMFAPTRPLSEEARAVVRSLVEEVHERFIQDVAAGRKPKLTETAVRKLADGRIYTGQQAKENGLVDELGGMHDALLGAGRLAGIRGKPGIKEYGAPSLWRWLFSGGGRSGGREVTVHGGLLYDDFAARLVRGALGPRARPEEL
jgi:protease-4